MTELIAFPDACQLQSILEAARQQGRRGTEALAAIRKIHAAPKLTLFIEDLRALMALPRGRLPCAVPDEQVMDVVAELTKIEPVHLIGMIRPMARRLGGLTAPPTPERKPKSQRVRIEPHSDPEALFGKRGVQSLKTAAQALGVSRRRISQLVEQGSLEKNPGKARGITTASLRTYLNLSSESAQPKKSVL